MEHKDLFSGIGGFALAARMVWGENQKPRLFCEKEPYARRVLNKNFPGVPCVEDIRDLRGDRSVTTDLVTAGFPCQPFSVAGKRTGQKDDRYLWPETLRFLQEDKPRWFIGENVPGIITLALDDVLASLESAGYEAEALIVPACAVNAQHRRDRVWIIAYASNPQLWQDNSTRSHNKRRDDSDSIQGRQKVSSGSESSCQEVVADAIGKGLEEWKGFTQNSYQKFSPVERSGHGIGTNPNWQHGNTGRLRTSQIPQLKASEIFGGKQWQSESGVCRMVNGVPHRVDRLRGLGNAIVPQVAAVLMAGIKEVDRVYNNAFQATFTRREHL